ncbi:hypothetical protein FPQ18DRAFT_311266 [Pyronema domesticum]|nr:hypothetical protein FPQ18DRAFT_311266 [Pyronema domesticum]
MPPGISNCRWECLFLPSSSSSFSSESDCSCRLRASHARTVLNNLSSYPPPDRAAASTLTRDEDQYAWLDLDPESITPLNPSAFEIVSYFDYPEKLTSFIVSATITGGKRETRERKFSDSTVTQSIRTTQTIRNVETSRTTETNRTALPVRKGLIDIVSDEPRPEIVSVVHMHGYQPFAVGDPNLQYADPFAFIHESTTRDAMYLTPGVPAETDISIKRLVDKRKESEKKKSLIKLPELKLPEIDVEQLPKKMPKKWQRYLTMSREKRTLCKELDERWESLLKRTEEYQIHVKLVDREYNIVSSSFPKTKLIRDCGKDLIDTKGKFEKFRGFQTGIPASGGTMTTLPSRSFSFFNPTFVVKGSCVTEICAHAMSLEPPGRVIHHVVDK